MEEFLFSLIPWGTGVIQAVQAGHTPFLDAFFIFVTHFGYDEGYLLLLPLIYWCIDASHGRRLGLLVFVALILNYLSKLVYAVPRPDPNLVRVLVDEPSPSFPSGHAQAILAMWGYLLVVWRNWVFRTLALIIIVLVGYSRVYLGVHFPQDIVGGWLLGLILLGLFLWLEPPVTARLRTWPLWGQLALAIAVPLGLFALKPVGALVPAAATMLGFAAGLVLERRQLGFDSVGSWQQRGLRYLGILLVIAVWAGLRLVFPAGEEFRFIRYVLTGFTATYVVPLIAIRLGWAPQASPSTGT